MIFLHSGGACCVSGMLCCLCALRPAQVYRFYICKGQACESMVLYACFLTHFEMCLHGPPCAFPCNACAVARRGVHSLREPKLHRVGHAAAGSGIGLINPPCREVLGWKWRRRRGNRRRRTGSVVYNRADWGGDTRPGRVAHAHVSLTCAS